MKMNDLDVEVDAEKGPYLDVEVVGRQDELKQGLLLHLDSSVMSSQNFLHRPDSGLGSIRTATRVGEKLSRRG